MNLSNQLTMPGYVYFLSNPSMPDLLKIGHTTDTPENRIRQLNTTGIPSSFVLEACFLVSNPHELEKSMHTALAMFRPAQNREFFKLSLAQALELTLPIILESAKNKSFETLETIQTQHDLDEKEVHILQLLTSAGGQYGMNQYRLTDRTDLIDLDLEIRLANLFAKRFVTKSREAGGYGYVWKSTPKGVKFLSDNNLIEEWMRDQPWR